MLISSGLSHTPRSEKAEISIQLSDEDSYSKHIKDMRTLLEPYSDDKQTDTMKFEDCGGTQNLHGRLSVIPDDLIVTKCYTFSVA